MATQERESTKKTYTSYEEYHSNFYGTGQPERVRDWDETPTSFAKWLTRSILLKAGTKKSTEEPTD
jgi:hypothetical protein